MPDDQHSSPFACKRFRGAHALKIGAACKRAFYPARSRRIARSTTLCIGKAIAVATCSKRRDGSQYCQTRCPRKHAFLPCLRDA